MGGPNGLGWVCHPASDLAAADSVCPMRTRRYISHQAAHLHVAHESAPLVEALPVRGLRSAGRLARHVRPDVECAVPLHRNRLNGARA
jgi:hypothetical protein